jgi:hypothetical protein
LKTLITGNKLSELNHTHECNFDTYDTLECDLYAKSVISIRHSVIITRLRLVSTGRVRFPHAVMERSSSTGLNQILVVVPHK